MVGDVGFEPAALCATCISSSSHDTLRMAPVLAEVAMAEYLFLGSMLVVKLPSRCNRAVHQSDDV